jgi:hypothetical protein
MKKVKTKRNKKNAPPHTPPFFVFVFCFLFFFFGEVSLLLMMHEKQRLCIGGRYLNIIKRLDLDLGLSLEIRFLFFVLLFLYLNLFDRNRLKKA